MTAPIFALLLAVRLFTTASPVAPPLSAAAPVATMPTVSQADYGSEALQVSGIDRWVAETCNPKPAGVQIWNLTTQDTALGQPSGVAVIPGNVNFSELHWGVAILATTGQAVTWDSGCLVDGVANSETVADEAKAIGSVNHLSQLPAMQTTIGLPVLPGASSSTQPETKTVAELTAPAPSTSTSAPARSGPSSVAT